jgi:hypothetical protein
MPETEKLSLTHAELAEALVKHYDIHEGLWAIYVEFGLAGGNVGPDQSSINPAAIVPITKIGIQKVSESNNMTVDAVSVNPQKKRSTKKK